MFWEMQDWVIGKQKEVVPYRYLQRQCIWPHWYPGEPGVRDWELASRGRPFQNENREETGTGIIKTKDFRHRGRAEPGWWDSTSTKKNDFWNTFEILPKFQMESRTSGKIMTWWEKSLSLSNFMRMKFQHFIIPTLINFIPKQLYIT